MTKTVKVSDDNHERLTTHSQTHKLSLDNIIGYLLDQNEKVNLFDPNWAYKEAEKQFQYILEDADIDFRKKIELDKHRAILKSKQMVFQEYMKILPREEKRDFIESILGDTKSGNFLENLSSYQMFIIDGEKKLYLPDIDGFPKIPGLSKERLQRCERGYHVKNNRCNCRLWRECVFGSSQYENWLAQFGSESDQRKYLEETTGQKHFIRRDYR